MYDDNAPTLWGCLKVMLVGALIAVALWFLGAIFGLVSLPFHAASNTIGTAHGVIDRTMNPDNAIRNYNWFHDASARLDTYPVSIGKAYKLAHDAEKRSNEDAAERHRTELTGLEQACVSLVSEYNAKSSTITAGFFRNPENFLPVAATPWQPLPERYPTSTCEEPIEPIVPTAR